MGEERRADGVQRLAGAYWKRRYTVLFYSLLLTLAVGPLFTMLGLDARLVELFVLVNLLVAGTGATERGRGAYLTVLLAVGVLGLVSELRGLGFLATGSVFLGSALVLAAAWSAFRASVHTAQVDAEHIYGALSAYLLAGLFFGFLAYGVEREAPGSYLHQGAPFPLGVFNLPRAIYFSFVTLATLGYGDIVPATDLTRGVAVVEAVAGQLYIAVMVARLVGLYGSSRGPGGGTDH